MGGVEQPLFIFHRPVLHPLLHQKVRFQRVAVLLHPEDGRVGVKQPQNLGTGLIGDHLPHPVAVGEHAVQMAVQKAAQTVVDAVDRHPA